jgi:TraB/PrgY/gumN family
MPLHKHVCRHQPSFQRINSVISVREQPDRRRSGSPRLSILALPVVLLLLLLPMLLLLWYSSTHHHHHHHAIMVTALVNQVTNERLRNGRISPHCSFFKPNGNDKMDCHDGDDELDTATPILPSSSSSSLATTTKIDRRSWMSQTIRHVLVGGSAVAMDADVLHHRRPPDAAASMTTTTTDTKSAVVCDSTISVWTFPGDRTGDSSSSSSSSNSCTVYLLGTAHISDVSASLAGALVRQVHPDAVFVELDIKRIQNLPTMPSISAVPSTTTTTTTTTTSWPSSDNGDSIIESTGTTKPAILVPLVSPSHSLSSSLESPMTSTNGSAIGASGNKNWFQRRILNLAGAAVGKGISSMYSSLSSSGFQPGEEFAEAIRTGRDVGATIVLGDQDVQITLQRLAEALSMTDLNQLLNPDSELERTMSNLLPSLPPPSPSGNSNNDPTQFKRELSDYVEQMKSRETVRTIVQELNTVAPEVVRVMLTERDVYMANGLHTLRRSYPQVVAVMGLAHIDGVERHLQSLGWTPVQLSCPK